MYVKSIIIYPIKGCKGIEVDSCVALERGFENDRRYMLVDRNNKFVSQRSHPQLALITIKIVNEHIEVVYNQSSFSFDMSAQMDQVIDIALFDNTVQGTIVSEEVNDQFTSMLGDQMRLVKMTTEDMRHKKLIKGPDQTEVSFADGYPYLIAGTESLNQLNSKLDAPVMMDRFRPNIIIETDVPHIEDSWESVKIGSVDMMVIKPCARCPVVTIDQQTSEKSKHTLKVLSSYRKKDNMVYFGANVIQLKAGTIQKGDKVVVL